MPSKKKGTYQGKAESPTVGPTKIALQLCNQSACTNYLLLFFYLINTGENWGSGPFCPHTQGRRPWLESVINSPIASCIISKSSFPTGDSDYGQNSDFLLVSRLIKSSIHPSIHSLSHQDNQQLPQQLMTGHFISIGWKWGSFFFSFWANSGMSPHKKASRDFGGPCGQMTSLKTGILIFKEALSPVLASSH